MSAPETLVDLLCQRAGDEPGRQLYTFLADGERPQGQLSRGQLEARARAIAAELQGAGAAGERALLLHPPGLELIAAFFGCLFAGAVAVPAFPPRGRRNLPRLRAIAEDALPRWVLTTADWQARTQSWAATIPELARAAVVATDRVPADAGEAWRRPQLRPDSLAFLQYTSGSTATPKGVMVSHGNLLHNEAAIARAFRQHGGRTVLGWLPLHHDMGLIGNVLQPLYSGGQAILMSPPAFLQQPARWLRAICRYRAHTSGGPNFAYELCVEKVSEAERAELDLSSWEVAFNGAEPVRAATLERFARAFEPCGFRRRAFIPCFGLAEATLLVAGGGDRPGRVRRLSAAGLEAGEVAEPAAGEAARPLVSCGEVAAGSRVLAVDPQTARPCAPDRIGEIWVAGKGSTRGSVAGGYWQRPEATAETFAAHLDSGDGPFLRTGDLGFLAPGGAELFITGRLKDLIILRGRNHYPQDLELTAEGSHRDLEPRGGAAFAVEGDTAERLVLVHELRRRPQAEPRVIAEALRRAVAEAHEVQIDEVVLIRVGSLPRTTSGKVRRRACADAYRAGQLRVVAASPAAAASAAAASSAAPAVEPQPVDGSPIAGREALLALPAGERYDGLVATLLARAVQAGGRAAGSGADAAAGGAAADLSLVAIGLDSLAVAELRHTLQEDFGAAPSWERLMSEATLGALATELLAAVETVSPPVDFPPSAEAPPAEAPPAEAPPAEAPPAADTDGEMPLSQGQRGLWLQSLLAPDSAADNLSFAARLSGAWDEPALERGLAGWIERHPALRTTFPARDSMPCQYIDPEARLEIDRVDASQWDPAQLAQRLAEAAHTPFDLAHGPLVRVHLWRCAGGDAVLLLVAHHAVIDLASLFVLLDELGATYSSAARGDSFEPAAEPAADVASIVRQQQQQLAGAAGEALWRYWRDRLAGFDPILEWPSDRPRPPVLRYRGAALADRLPQGLAGRLRGLARGARSTLYSVLLAAFQTLLHRLTGQRDLVVGSPFAGRTRPQLARRVGYFVNPLPLRADLAGDPSCESLLAATAASVAGALEHQDFPAALLVEKLRPRRDPGRHPLFQAFFAVERTPRRRDEGLAAFVLGQAGARVQLGDLTLESVDLATRVAPFDLTCRWIADRGGLRGQWVYSTDLFDAVTVDRLARRFRSLLESMVREPGRRLSELELLTPAERQQLQVEWNDTAVDRNRQGPGLHHLFTAQAARTPRAAALLSAGDTWSYDDLAARVERLAQRLRRAGVGPEQRVGLAFERGPEMVVALLAVLEAAGAYVPLDPTHPPQRLALMARDAGIGLLLTNAVAPVDVPGFTGGVLGLDAGGDAAWHRRASGGGRGSGGASTSPAQAAGPGRLSAETLAYVLFTSGTTGRPKGVMIPHSAAVNFLAAMRRRPGFAAADHLLAVTTLAFDISLLELLLPLTVGARVEIVSRAAAADGRQLARRLVESGATVMQATPATWRMLLDAGWQPPRAFGVLSGGEALPADLAKRLHAGGARLWNLYGPTETTVWSATGEVTRRDGGLITAGRPIDNTVLRILGRDLAAAPAGSSGELLIGGAGLARGYLGRPALTARQFIPDPGSRQAGGRLYRTGDLARLRRDGRLEVLGRIDHQVKVRGFRIELEEIEVALRDLEEVADAVVLARQDLPGHRRLVAYLVPAVDEAPDAETLRRRLAERLPDYMLPSAFVALAALPLNRSGKIDRAALARREPETSPAAAGGAPRSSIERRLAGLWQELLGRQAVGLDDNFFELGGDSILGVRVAAGAARAGLELTPALLHEHQTLGDLSRAAAEHLAAKLERWLEVPRPPLEPLPVDFPTGGSAARGSAAHDSTQTSTRTIRVGLTPERTAALQHGVESADSRLDPRLATHTLLVAACLDAFAAWTGRRRLGLCLDLADRDASALLLLDLEEVTSPDAVLQAIEEQLRAAAAENLGRVGALVDPGSDLARRVAALPQPQVRLVLGENEPQRAALDEALLTIRGRTRDDRLGVDWTYRESSFRRATVERLAEACLAALERWIEHLAAPSSRELTPEDFPDVDLDQGQLDKILQQLG